jgi:RNA polymerase sporulation-specific sigma factor
VSYSITIHSQDANLYIQAQGGDAQSLKDLMRMHEGLVHHIVRQQWRGRLSYEQALHAGRIGLWRAILGFDPGRGYAFSTYAGVVIARHVWRAVRCAERAEETVRVPASPPSFVDPRTEVLAREVRAALLAMVAQSTGLQPASHTLSLAQGLD